MTLDSPIEVLNGVGKQAAEKLHRLGLSSALDMLENYPRRYEDYSIVTPVAKMKPGQISIRAQINNVSSRWARRGMHITEAVASDDTGSARLIWFNQPYRAQSIKRDQEYFLSGIFELRHQHLSIMSPSVELVSDFPVNTARIVPVYRETKGLTSRQIRAYLRQLLPLLRGLPETLPAWIMSENRLMSRAEAIEAMHFPATTEKLTAAKHRLGFEEVYELSLASMLNKNELGHEHAPPVPFDERVAKELVRHLPFQLTDAQRTVAWQVYLDMEKSRPMNRLVEGDVGSGKTVVAAMAAAMALHRGHQVAFMAPTELLARQHADSLQNLLKPIGYDTEVGLLVGSMNAKQKARAYDAITSGKMRLLVGTHALIQEAVDMHTLELVIIDEQHRFGVEQRKKLQAKSGHMPHVLSLTATPIPRSLALTLYGELDISILGTKPAGRKPIITKIWSPNSRKQLYGKIDAELQAGRQLFVVCPLISDSSQSSGDQLSAADTPNSAETVFKELSLKTFKHWHVGLLHGKMKADEKNRVMQQFVAHDLDILVATTVIEVGVDVPNASTMLIENAERFGLAQIHQLRGRVGRGSAQGYCFLMPGDSNPPSRRMRALETSDDGFKLAELDLQLRGPGAIYGHVQHGQLDLRVAQLTDAKLIASARAAAQKTVEKSEDLLQYPELNDHITRLRAVTNLN